MPEQGPYDDWWAVVFAVLEARANDEVEPEAEEIEKAVLSLAAVTMVGVGMDPDEITEKLSYSEFQIHMGYDPESDQVTVSLDWGEGSDFTFTSDISDLT
jgi:hypothetical protein